MLEAHRWVLVGDDKRLGGKSGRWLALFDHLHRKLSDARGRYMHRSVSHDRQMRVPAQSPDHHLCPVPQWMCHGQKVPMLDEVRCLADLDRPLLDWRKDRLYDEVRPDGDPVVLDLDHLL